MTPNCPECLSPLRTNAKSCRCGWKISQATPSVEPAIPDSRCHFIRGEKRCPLLGTIAEGVRNPNLLCSPHWNARHDRMLSNALLDDILANPALWIPEKDWRVELLEAHLKANQTQVVQSKSSVESQLEKLKQRILMAKIIS